MWKQMIFPAALAIMATLAQGATFTIAPNGKDTNPGTTEQPMATLEAARDAARKAEGGPHRIVLMPGDYFLARTLELDARDNGLTIEAGEGGQVTLYGGALVTGWQRDGDKFWCADLPGVKEGTWDFRALVVNGRMPDRARMPESDTFLHKSVWDVRCLPNIAGDWERKPTQEELTTMLYDPKDIPTTLDVRNAEVRIYHMWSESLCGVTRNDTQRGALIFATPPICAPGAFGIKKYVVFNTREGMTHPGQWYLDRTAGRVVYWPLPGEDMAKAKVIAPKLEGIVRIAGTKEKPVENLTMRGLSLQAATTPINKQGSWVAGNFDGALHMEHARQCAMEKLEICNVGGQGIQCQRYQPALIGCRIAECHIHHTGACGIIADGADLTLARNHIHHVGVYYPSAVAISAGHFSPNEEEKGLHIYRNEIHDTPYSGIVGGGSNNLIEENLIYRVMREMHDGAAIYGNLVKTVLRGNVVRDVVEFGKGFGVSAYYLDEGARDCLIERNVSIGVERPTHNHITRNITIRDNVFIAEADMKLSFQTSSGCVFEGNTLFVPRNISITCPNAVKVWQGNRIFRNGVGKDGAPQPFTIDDAMPPAPQPGRKTSPAAVTRAATPPTLDGEIESAEWPGALLSLDRDPTRWSGSGAPVYTRLAYDDRCLYVGVLTPMFEVSTLTKGAAWGQDDGAEISIAGKMPDGKPATFVLRGFAGGVLQSATDAGAPAEAAERLGKETRFVAKVYGKGKGKGRGGWRGEWAIPLEALGLKPAPGLKVPFNIAVFRNEDHVWRCWEGTLAESWRLDQAGVMEFK